MNQFDTLLNLILFNSYHYYIDDDINNIDGNDNFKSGSFNVLMFLFCEFKILLHQLSKIHH